MTKVGSLVESEMLYKMNLVPSKSDKYSLRYATWKLACTPLWMIEMYTVTPDQVCMTMFDFVNTAPSGSKYTVLALQLHVAAKHANGIEIGWDSAKIGFSICDRLWHNTNPHLTWHHFCNNVFSYFFFYADVEHNFPWYSRMCSTSWCKNGFNWIKTCGDIELAKLRINPHLTVWGVVQAYVTQLDVTHFWRLHKLPLVISR